MTRREHSPKAGGPLTLAVTSGKGGVGKTTVVVNLAVALARARSRVAVIDADFGLGNVDVLLGLQPVRHLGHVLAGACELEDILVRGPHDLRIAPAGSGLGELTALAPRHWARLQAGLERLGRDLDYLLIDTGAGISANVVNLVHAAGRALVVTSPEPTAIVDAYATIKVLTVRAAAPTPALLVNGAHGPDEADLVFRQLEAAVRRFLHRPLDSFGFIDDDAAVREAVLAQRAVVDSAPDAPASRAFRRLANRVASLVPPGGPGLRLVGRPAVAGPLPRVEASQCA